MKSKPAYHHGDLRRTLFDASLRLIEEKGLPALSLREVARRAGVTHQAPYHHFADRAALLAALADEGYALLLAAMQEAQARAKRAPLAQLEAAGLGYLKFALAHPAWFRLMFRSSVTEGAPSQAGAAAYGVLVGAVLAAQREGEVRRGKTEAVVMLCWSAVHGLACLWLDAPERISGQRPEKAAREVVGVLMRLLAADARTR